MTEIASRVRTTCARCETPGWAPERRAKEWTCSDCRTLTKAPEPRNVDWPALVAACERRGIPALRVDDRGDLHVIRTTAQLAKEWEA